MNTISLEIQSCRRDFTTLRHIPNQSVIMSTAAQSPYKIQVLTSLETHEFVKPTKKINDERDVSTFHTSGAYRDICLLILQLNMAMCPRKPSATLEQGQTWKLDAPIELQQPVRQLQQLLQRCNDIIDEVPPDTGPRRFGNASFRKWHEVLELRARSLLQEYLPPSVLNCGSSSGSGSGDDGKVSVLDELMPYFMGSFGSSQRLDYGTGHELSFLAFLGCLWKLGGFSDEEAETMTTSRNIVIGVMEPYWRVVRRLILTYTLEPAGSHGVWGLDDHSFIPYIFGSSQYCPAIDENEAMPEEGSYPDTPSPTGISKKPIVDREREHNMFFSAVGFINDVKTGPFWEHSPMLFDISGIRAGWGKINKGMIKMYNAEVLSKFPVIQHFPFGSLFTWNQEQQTEITGARSCPPNKFQMEAGKAPRAHGLSQTDKQTNVAATWVSPAASRAGGRQNY
ncbi:unnamed protein product [Blumeria hordei]|uniref:Serine/threonine-protein phosphatase 2A activator n=1 Tax=Blumeria hordei TaxID=2867405 RepID=A0A383UNG4_BLUHO|nr:unnamed protein product [Blumeria hordei]